MSCRTALQRCATALASFSSRQPGSLPYSCPSTAASTLSCPSIAIELLRPSLGGSREPSTPAGIRATSPSDTASSPSLSSASPSSPPPLAFQIALDEGHDEDELVTLAAGALVIIFSCWWLYFDRQRHDRLTTLRYAFTWGYGHWFIFASLAAVGAGIAPVIDYRTDHTALSAVETGYTVAIPAAALTS